MLELWFGASESNFDHLQRLQNRLVRAVKKPPYHAHVTEARNSLHLLVRKLVRDRITHKVAVTAYGASVNQISSCLAELLFFLAQRLTCYKLW